MAEKKVARWVVSLGGLKVEKKARTREYLLAVKLAAC